MSSGRSRRRAVVTPASSSGGHRPAVDPARVTHRGVQWRRVASGTITWHNDGLNRWVTWYPGSDAPPLPPGWGPAEEDGPGAPAVAVAAAASPSGAPGRGRPVGGPVPLERPPMRSPWRVVPIVIAVAVVALALWQALKPAGSASAADISAAHALEGQCLAKVGGTEKSPIIGASAVECSSKRAAVKVVSIALEQRSCPAGTAAVQVVDAGVKGEPYECVAPVKGLE